MFHEHNLHSAPFLIFLKEELPSRLKMRGGVGWRGRTKKGGSVGVLRGRCGLFEKETINTE